MELGGVIEYGLFFLSFVGIYALLSLGLNLQWGLTGQFNIGIAGFFAVGAYTSAILTTAPSPHHLGGFGMPLVVGLIVAMVLAGLVAVLVGLLTVRLRTDYLAIATIGIAEIIRLGLKNEEWLTNGVRGIPGIPRPFAETLGQSDGVFLLVIVVLILMVYLALEAARRSPWGRVLRAIRENEDGVRAAGKHIERFRLEAFVVGSMIMGLGGALFRALRRLYQSRGLHAGIRDLPRLGDADRRRQRQQQGRGAWGIDHLAGLDRHRVPHQHGAARIRDPGRRPQAPDDRDIGAGDPAGPAGRPAARRDR